MVSRTTRRIGFLVFDRIQGLDVFGPLEVFDAASNHLEHARSKSTQKRAYETWILSPDGNPVMTSSGVSLVPHASIQNCPRLHTLIIPGGAGARIPDFSPRVLRWIQSRAPSTPRIGSICTGLFILAETGLLDGQRVTTHWQHRETAQARFPRVQVDAEAIFLRHGKLFTAAGISAGIDLALALIEEDHGPTLASRVARYLVVFLKRPGDQRQFSSILQHQMESVPEFSDLVAWIVGHLHADLSSSQLARRIGLSERQFRRKFLEAFGCTPTKYIEQIRIKTAQDWLISESITIDRIAQDSGFQDTDTFRRVFDRYTGVSPSEYRSRFRASGPRHA